MLEKYVISELASNSFEGSDLSKLLKVTVLVKPCTVRDVLWV